MKTNSMKLRLIKTIAVCIFCLLPAGHLGAGPSLYEQIGKKVYLIHDDDGNTPTNRAWSTGMGETHQNGPDYWAKKVLDLSSLPEDVWQATKEIRISAFFMVLDYGGDGLDESFEVEVNGNVHRYRTNSGAPALPNAGAGPVWNWYDFVIPKQEFTKGNNEIIIRKASSAANDTKPDDDYLYLGIDNSVRRGNSFVSFNGGAGWTQDELTIPGGNGEYLVRIYLFTGDTSTEARWRPGSSQEFSDPDSLILYAGNRDGTRTETGLILNRGASARMEWSPGRFDPLHPLTVSVKTKGEISFAWLNKKGDLSQTTTGPSPLTAALPANRPWQPAGLIISPAGASAVLQEVVVDAAISYHPQPEPPVDMCPRISRPAGSPANRTPSCQIENKVISLQNAAIRCRFTAAEHLNLVSLYNEYAASEMIRNPEKINLFVVEVAGERYSGSSDFLCREIIRTPRGFTAVLTLKEAPLEVLFTASAETEDIRFGLKVTNTGTENVDFKVSFPNLSGLGISNDPAGDYYFFPWKGGAIADLPVLVRKGYGSTGGNFQLLDLFSPERGAGLYLRTDDTDGGYKVFSLRKWIPGRKEGVFDDAAADPAVKTDLKMANPLDTVPGTGMSCDYIQRTRPPGGNFTLPDVLLAAHGGDWHEAMKSYADWAHRVWKFRPYPSALEPVLTMECVGWRSANELYRDGKYRTDIIPPFCDLLELWSWWNWTTLGPWEQPIIAVDESRGFVTDPATGQVMYTLARGDYDGYNERWGGLPAFQKAIKTYQDKDVKALLYTCPGIADDNTKVGKKLGKEFAVIMPDGAPRKDYDSWRMCHDIPDYRQFVADTAGRLMRETGADGIRFDEYGVAEAFTCYSKVHKHTFAEIPGWPEMRAIAETCRLARSSMNEAKPQSILMTEFPGYDFMWQFLDGTLAYDMKSYDATPLRPLECNLQRFYFPECKVYELVESMAGDPKFNKRLWNAVSVYGWDSVPVYGQKEYALFHENSAVFDSRDCQPLIPTPSKRIYANRFTGGGKTIYTIFNGTGHSFGGPVLRLALNPGEHLFDLTNCRSCEPEKKGNEYSVALYLERNETAWIVRLPKQVSISVEKNLVTVRMKSPGESYRVALCDSSGGEIASQPASPEGNSFDLSQGTNHLAACVKLFDNKQLVDVAALPR
ncbi:MAG: DUF6259 domain-containing protein [Candidatus Omnitrophota bacterium]